MELVNNPGPFRQLSVRAAIHDVLDGTPNGTCRTVGPINGYSARKLQTVVIQVAGIMGWSITTKSAGQGRVDAWFLA